MTLRHISPRSSDWQDAMDEGGRGWDKLAPEEMKKLRVGAQLAGTWDTSGKEAEIEPSQGDSSGDGDDYGWRAGSASK